jgi:3-hydroxymyristoyl/3-hydroxydecanoyl-(acyl carrier protein) dehydratase/nucleoside-diphosphate-sugar epimerase
MASLNDRPAHLKLVQATQQSVAEAHREFLEAQARVHQEVLMQRDRALATLLSIARDAGEPSQLTTSTPDMTLLPGAPLRLVERISGITGGSGGKPFTLSTETDVRWESWYLHQGVMPAGLLFEAAQGLNLLLAKADRKNYGLRSCDVTYFGELPRPGSRLSFDVRLKDVIECDCRIDGELRFSIRNGTVGPTRLSGGLTPPATAHGSNTHEGSSSFSFKQVQAFSEGRVFDCFGSGFEYAQTHARPPKISQGRMRLIDEVVVIGTGFIHATASVSPDAWFFETGWRRMPHSLMLEGCYQAMSFLLAASGCSLDKDGWRFEPIPGQAQHFDWFGEVGPAARRLAYDVKIRHFNRDVIPRVIADVTVFADDEVVMRGTNLGVTMVPDWPLTSQPELLAGIQEQGVLVAERNGFRFGYASLLASASGKPSEAFGPMVRSFDGPRRLPRLPAPPWLMVSRVTRLDAELNLPNPGSSIETAYDIPEGAWYFGEGAINTMPLAVLLEAALQTCGWLVVYIACGVAREKDMFLRVLDGTCTLLQNVDQTDGTLTTRAKVLNVKSASGLVLLTFEVTGSVREQLVYRLETIIGIFPQEDLDRQSGLPAGEEDRRVLTEPSPFEAEMRTDPPAYCRAPLPFAAGPLLMIHRVTGFWPRGGLAGLGLLRGERLVDADDWYFKAHFLRDPVQPGSLGVQGLQQLIQFYMLHEGFYSEVDAPRFSTLTLNRPMKWKFRGQVLPKRARLSFTIEILEIRKDERGVHCIANGSVWLDDLRIYDAQDLGMSILSGALARSSDCSPVEAQLRSLNEDLIAVETGDASRLDVVLDDACRRRLKQPIRFPSTNRRILLFGASGFIGSHLLHRLLSDSRVDHVYSIVRPGGNEHISRRVFAAWEKYELNSNQAVPERATFFRGSLSEENFGLTQSDYKRLAAEVDTVIHCAGSPDYNSSYSKLRPGGVSGLLQVIRFCLAGRIKALSYMGSVIAHLYRAPEDFRRSDSFWYSGYAQTKWVSQQILKHLGRAGLPVQICEAPHVFGGVRVGKDPGYEYAYWRILKIAAATKVAWDGQLAAFVPVDLLVDATVHNTLSENPLPLIRPIIPTSLKIADWAPLLGSRVIPWEQFRRTIEPFASPQQLKLIPHDMPELIERTNLPAIFPADFDLKGFPTIRELGELYLTQMNFARVPSEV